MAETFPESLTSAPGVLGENNTFSHQADDLEEVDLSEIMAVMRSPEKLEEVLDLSDSFFCGWNVSI